MKILLIFCTLLLIRDSYSAITSVFNCYSMYSSNCEISSKTLTHDSDFKPKSNAPTSVTSFKIYSSTIPRLTPNVCLTLPNLIKFVAREISLEVVDVDTFIDCKKITEIDLEKNYITNFASNTFNRNPTLVNLQLWLNRLQFIPEDLFNNLGSLTTIDLSSNNLSYFPATIGRDMKKLTSLSLCNNRILDMDVKSFLEYVPSLVTLNLRDNDFECDRFREIKNELLAKKLTISTTTDTIRIRSYGIRKVDGVECVDKPTWNYLKMMRSLEGTVSNLTSNVTKTTEEFLKVKEEIKNVENSLTVKIEKNEEEITNFQSTKDELVIINENIDEIKRNSSENLESVYKRIDSDKDIIMSEVNENKVKFQTLSQYMDTELIKINENISSIEMLIAQDVEETYKKHEKSMGSHETSLTGLWTYVILLTLAFLAIAFGVGFLVKRYFNQVTFMVSKMTNVNGDLTSNQFENPHPL